MGVLIFFKLNERVALEESRRCYDRSWSWPTQKYTFGSHIDRSPSRRSGRDLKTFFKSRFIYESGLFFLLLNDTSGVVIPFLKYVFFTLHILETGSFQYE